MNKLKYNFQKDVDSKKSARAKFKNKAISTKYSIEISNYLKNKPLNKAIKILTDISEKKTHLPLKKFNKKVAHRKGDSLRKTVSGKYPIKASKEILKLLEYVKSNAEEKNLDLDKLKIIHMYANKGVTRTKLQPLGRVGGKTRESKSTNIEVIVLEE